MMLWEVGLCIDHEIIPISPYMSLDINKQVHQKMDGHNCLRCGHSGSTELGHEGRLICV